MDRYFNSSFPFISRARDDAHCSRDTAAVPVRGGKQEAGVKETVEAQRVVYVIDDDASMRDSIKSLLGSVGLCVETFGSAPEFFGKKLPDAAMCLVVDVRLPGLSGLDFQAALSQANIDVPIIFITGHGDIAMTVKAMKAGAVEFLAKPFRDQDLLDAVKLGLEKNETKRLGQKINAIVNSLFDSLTPREQEVMGLVTTGLMNKQVAAEMGVSEITVKVHRGNVMRKMKASSLVDLVRMADMLGIRRSKA
jgi:FixJ family two-component response regulator